MRTPITRRIELYITTAQIAIPLVIIAVESVRIHYLRRKLKAAQKKSPIKELD